MVIDFSEPSSCFQVFEEWSIKILKSHFDEVILNDIEGI